MHYAYRNEKNRSLWNNEFVQRHVIKSSFSRQVSDLVAAVFLMAPIQEVSVGFHLPWPIQQRETKNSLVCIYPGRMTLIFPDLPKILQKSLFFPSNSFVYLFVPVSDWLQLQWSVWSDLISSTDVWISQLPLFADICCRISPCRGFSLLFCFTLGFCCLLQP